MNRNAPAEFFAGLTAPFRDFLMEIGGVLTLFGRCLWLLVRPPFRYSEFVRQFDFIGVQSTILIVFTGTFTGMVSALQAHHGMHRFGAESLVGATVALTLTRELGPVISALMLTARVGSAITAEMGAMRNTQQIDALVGMAVDPIQYLVAPKVVAAALMLPILALFFSFSGMLGAYAVSVRNLGVDFGTFIAGVRYWLDIQDITHGMLKSLVFGLIISLIACHKGFYATGGARGVGAATTRSVVISSVMILVTDYFMTALMFKPS